MSNNILSKAEEAKKIIRNAKKVIIAFSGGVDSSLVAKLAHEALEGDAIAVTAVSPTYPDIEVKIAEQMAKEIGINHMLIHTSELENENFSSNPADRCYYCKTELFAKLKEIAAKEGAHAILDGTNASDLSDHRPGIIAARKNGVVSPLALAEINKEEARELARFFGLSNWNKPSMACLASRVPYYEKITQEKLDMINSAENFIRNLGIKQVRVRYHSDKIARIEVPKDDFPILLSFTLQIIEHFRKIGFLFVTLDLEGYVSGSMNKLLI
ncbi:MAG: ATP-dependent sacrificial sulfur transferase LarE [Euryarchaeota archaeon]|nr:ATP-dependent sacrificial sulfur transferase LarE [Euryarchaeota archaeon]